MMNHEKNARLLYFDFLRGVAICMVVAIHTFLPCSFDNIGDYIAISIRQICNAAVPLFLAISGFFLGRKELNSWQSIHSFWGRQIPKVYIPCLVYSLPIFAWGLIEEEKSMLVNVAYFLFCGYSVYDVVALIVQYYLLLPILKRFNKLGGVIFCGLISSICILVYTYYIRKIYPDVPLILGAGLFPLWIVFFMLGLYLSNKARNYSISGLMILFIIGILLQFIEGKYISSLFGASFGVKFSSFLFSIVTILLLFSRKLESWYEAKRFRFKIIEYIGSISFSVYLLHCYIREVVNSLVTIDVWAFKWLLVLAVTILCIQIAKYLLPVKIADRFLGIK